EEHPAKVACVGPRAGVATQWRSASAPLPGYPIYDTRLGEKSRINASRRVPRCASFSLRPCVPSQGAAASGEVASTGGRYAVVAARCSARRLPPRLRLHADIFIGGRVDIVGNQAQAGDRHPWAGDTQEAQLPDRHEIRLVIHLLLY